MPNTPNYKLNRTPRFSVNHLTQYLVARNANQREKIIREAKFQKKVRVVSYAQSKRAMSDFLAGNTGDLSYFDDHTRRFETRRRREPEGWMRDEMDRNIEAVAAFKTTFSRRRARRYQFAAGPSNRSIRFEGVSINVRLDALVTYTDDEDVTYSGGCVLFLARTDTVRSNVEERRKSVAAMVHWSLEIADENIEVLPRLCMSFDVFGQTIVKAPRATNRLRSQIRSACNEAAARWDHVTPPSGYDGPHWR